MLNPWGGEAVVWEREFQGHTAPLLTSVGKFPSFEQISIHLLPTLEVHLEFLAFSSYLGHADNKLAQCLSPGVRAWLCLLCPAHVCPCPSPGEHGRVNTVRPPWQRPGLPQMTSREPSTQTCKYTFLASTHTAFPTRDHSRPYAEPQNKSHTFQRIEVTQYIFSEDNGNKLELSKH